MEDDLDWERVARELARRLDQLGMIQAELARRSSVSPITLRKLQAGVPANYRRDILGRVSQAVGWSPDSLMRIARGHQPLVAAVDAHAGEPAEPERPSVEEAIAAEDLIPPEDKERLLRMYRSLREAAALERERAGDREAG